MKPETKQTFLDWAELIDAYRVVPRIAVILFITLITYVLFYWVSFDTIDLIECDAKTMEVLLTHKVDPKEAKEIACNVKDIIGPPASFTTVFSVLIGAATGFFGLYANSGRKWDRKREED